MGSTDYTLFPLTVIESSSLLATHYDVSLHGSLEFSFPLGIHWQITDPIHDQTFFLDEEHNIKLKEEFGKSILLCEFIFMLPQSTLTLRENWNFVWNS
jgi:hypothetical protein